MEKLTPAIVIKSKFVTPSQREKSGNYQEFLNYMDRKDTHAHENELLEYETYQDYMANDEKSTGLFSSVSDSLNEKEKENMKDLFADCQNKGSILWQDVISFDNEWLKENQIIDGTHVDEKRLKQATRNGINAMLKKEGLSESAVWTAAIHFNTDNVHVHVATVQDSNFKERGKRKLGSLETMKSKVINNLIDKSKDYEKLNYFIREQVISKKREDDMMSLKNKIVNRDLVKQFKHIPQHLPEDKRLWKYNMNGIADTRKEIDKFTTLYIEKHFKKEFEDFKKTLDKEVENHKRLYGDSEKAEKYRDTKMTDLYTRMGNTVLNEIKEHDKKSSAVLSKPNVFKEQKDFKDVFYRIDRVMKNELQNYKNLNEFEKLQREKEMER
jgi:hypothetical protein